VGVRGNQLRIFSQRGHPESILVALVKPEEPVLIALTLTLSRGRGDNTHSAIALARAPCHQRMRWVSSSRRMA
jgi:hypothetical protein